jgi:hypothetical protein
VKYFFYRKFMEFMHRHNWHYAPEIGPLAPTGHMQKWCKWCGFRESYLPMGVRTASGIEALKRDVEWRHRERKEPTNG